MTIYERFLAVQKEIKQLSEEKLELERQIYTKHQKEIKEKGIGTASIIDGDYLVKVVSKETVKVDQQAAASLGGLGMRIKYDLDKKAYDNMLGNDKALVDACLTVIPAKPHFSVTKGEDIEY